MNQPLSTSVSGYMAELNSAISLKSAPKFHVKFSCYVYGKMLS